MGYGVSCNYGITGESLQLSAPGSFQVDLASLAPAEQVMDFGAWAVQGQLCTDTSTVPPSQVPDTTTTTSTAGPHSSCITSTRIGVHGKDPSSGLRANQHAGSAPIIPTYSGMSLFTPVSNNSNAVAIINDSMQLNFSNGDMQFGSADALRSGAPLYHFSEAHYEIMARFRSRTALTIGVKSMAPVYRDCVCQLASTVCSLYYFITMISNFVLV
jgi:hypothetical protein